VAECPLVSLFFTQYANNPRDVTDPDSVLAVDRAIRKDLPPVGGVVNGAMILLDQLLSSMSLDDWLKTIRPKVEGSTILNELYADNDLDFFILMGSISGHLGNSSQSAYAAANCFMSSLIQWRRERGLVGSIINPGQILGVGYVSNTDSSWLLEHLTDALGCYHVSEQDLHELFAEGILAGRPDSGRNPDIIAGFRAAKPAEQKDIIWYRNTKTWHFVDHSLEEEGASAGASIGKNGAQASVREQLSEAKSLEEAVAIVEKGFMAKLKNKLRMAEDADVAREAAPAELGVDSLVAVDLRTWFVKEVGVDVPVLKILGGMPLGQLAADVAGRVWMGMQPREGANGVEKKGSSGEERTGRKTVNGAGR
jgi:hypothetical protein